MADNAKEKVAKKDENQGVLLVHEDKSGTHEEEDECPQTYFRIPIDLFETGIANRAYH